MLSDPDCSIDNNVSVPSRVRHWTSAGALYRSISNNSSSSRQHNRSTGNFRLEIENGDPFVSRELRPISLNNPPLAEQAIKSDSDDSLNYKFSQCSLIFDNLENVTLTWSSIYVNVPDKSENICQKLLRKHRNYKPLGRKQILKNATGAALPGRLLAIMGASGAGKTTLLNVLTQRNTKGLTIEGEIKLNGREIGKNVRSISAYVQQDDLFIGTFKVKEHMQFQATLRLGKAYSKQQRDERVEQLLVELGLKKCENTIIGVKGQTKGISGGERKRLAFASELLTNPAMMFCDEPTSGLDSFMAQQVVSVLKEMSKKGKTIICTIHQPSSQVFRYFDDLCLLAEGRVAYMGPAKGVPSIFKKAKFPCPKNFNPADHYIRTLAIAPGQEKECKMRVKKICHLYQESEIAQTIREKISNNFNNSANNLDDIRLSGKNNYKAGWMTQFNALFWRATIQSIREPLLIQIRLWETIIISFILGLIYLNTELSGKTIQNINGLLFLFVLQMTFQFLFAVIHVFCEEYPVFLREHFSHMYRVDAYYLAKTLSELPQYIIMPVVFTAILYFMAGLTPSADVFFICTAINILSANVAVSLGYVVSTAFTDLNMAMTVTPILIIPFMLFAGFYVNENSIPVYFIWLKYLSYIKYSYEAISINQWRDVDYIPGCENFTCPINGTAVLQSLNFNPNLFDLDIVILCVMFIVLRIISYLALLIRTYVQND